MATTFKELLARAIGAGETLAVIQSQVAVLQGKLDQSILDLVTAKQTISTLTEDRDKQVASVTKLTSDLTAQTVECEKLIVQRNELQTRIDDPKSEGAKLAAKTLASLGIREPIAENEGAPATQLPEKWEDFAKVFSAETDLVKRSQMWSEWHAAHKQ